MSSIDTSSSTAGEIRDVDWGRYALIGLATVVAAVVANVIVYFIAGAIVAYDARFPPLASVGGPILFTLVPAIVAAVLYAALLRLSTNPERIFTLIAVVVLILSVIPDLFYIPTVPGSSTAQTAVLLLMHLVAATVIVGMLTTLTRSPSR
ncbi:MAG: hypothetical protein H0T18_03910 [Chloroflexia bacterium]|nr:hypothetical protein [Chloroflexia bacterium]